MSKPVIIGLCCLAFLIGAGGTLWVFTQKPSRTASEAIVSASSQKVEISIPTATETQNLVLSDETANIGKIVGSMRVASVGAEITDPDPVEETQEQSYDKPSKAVAASQNVELEVAEPVQKIWSGAVTLLYGFRPVYFEDETDGRYGLLSISVVRHLPANTRLSLTVPVIATPDPKEVVVSDPTIGLSVPITKLAGVAINSSLAVKPGLSLASRDADYHGSVSGALSATRSFGSLTTGAVALLTRRFYRHTFNRNGRANSMQTESASGFLSLELPASTAVTASLAYIKTLPYEGAAKYSYSNGIDLSWEATEKSVWSLGISNSDSQLAPDGDDNNVFTVYRQNKTEMYLSVSYAL